MTKRTKSRRSRKAVRSPLKDDKEEEQKKQTSLQQQLVALMKRLVEKPGPENRPTVLE